MDARGWSRQLPPLPPLPENPEALRNFDVAAAVRVYADLQDRDEVQQPEPDQERHRNAIRAVNEYLRIEGEYEAHLHFHPYRERHPLGVFFEDFRRWPADPHEAACMVYARLRAVVDTREQLEVPAFRREVLRLRDLAIRLDTRPEPYVVRIQELPYGKTETETLVLVRAGQFEIYLKRDNITQTTRPVDFEYREESECYRIPPGRTNNFALWTADDVTNWLRFFNLDDNVMGIFEGMNGLQLFHKLHEDNHLQPMYRMWTPESQHLVDVHLAPRPVLPRQVFNLLRDHINKLHNLLTGHKRF